MGSERHRQSRHPLSEVRCRAYSPEMSRHTQSCLVRESSRSHIQSCPGFKFHMSIAKHVFVREITCTHVRKFPMCLSLAIMALSGNQVAVISSLVRESIRSHIQSHPVLSGFQISYVHRQTRFCSGNNLHPCPEISNVPFTRDHGPVRESSRSHIQSCPGINSQSYPVTSSLVRVSNFICPSPNTFLSGK